MGKQGSVLNLLIDQYYKGGKRVPRLWACYIVYNEAKFIQRSVRSIVDHVDGVLMIDGAYENYPLTGDNFLSTDDTLKIAEKTVKNKIPFIAVKPYKPWKSQVYKRNVYLEMVPRGDWILIMDGDWQAAWLPGVEEHVREAMKTKRVDGFTVTLDKYAPGGKAYIFKWGNPLIFRNVEGLHYKYNHYSLYDWQERYFYDPPYKFEDSKLIIVHWGEYKNREYIKNKMKYYFNRSGEKASGREKFVCSNCKLHFQLKEGSTLSCPKCKSHILCAEVKETFAG